MSAASNDRVERAARIDICDGDDEEREREEGIRELLGDILVYCRDHKIRFEKVMIDAILERIE